MQNENDQRGNVFHKQKTEIQNYYENIRMLNEENKNLQLEKLVLQSKMDELTKCMLYLL